MTNNLKRKVEDILNPNKAKLEMCFEQIKKGNETYKDSIFYAKEDKYLDLKNKMEYALSNGNEDLQMEFDMNPDLLKSHYKKPNFLSSLRTVLDNNYYKVTFTGTSIVASRGTEYLLENLLTSLFFAILSIAILMAILFRSWRMVIVSMIPNLIPLFITGGIMGWLGIPLKPSTLLVFSIAFGISVDDTIHYLAKYRLEIKQNKWDLKQCVINAISEAGIGMFYTSIVLYCGFSVFVFSQFGGTQALGLLVSVTLLIAMLTNLVLLPSLLLSIDKRVALKAFKEPFFEAYSSENEVDWDELKLMSKESDNENKDVDI